MYPSASGSEPIIVNLRCRGCLRNLLEMVDYLQAYTAGKGQG